MPHEEPYPEEEFVEDNTPIGKDIAKDLPPTLEDPLPHPQKSADKSPLHIPSSPPLPYLVMVIALPMNTTWTQLLHRESRPDFPVPNPQRTM